jgi:hypothetical protein
MPRQDLILERQTLYKVLKPFNTMNVETGTRGWKVIHDQIKYHTIRRRLARAEASLRRPRHTRGAIHRELPIVERHCANDILGGLIQYRMQFTERMKEGAALNITKSSKKTLKF